MAYSSFKVIIQTRSEGAFIVQFFTKRRLSWITAQCFNPLELTKFDRLHVVCLTEIGIKSVVLQTLVINVFTLYSSSSRISKKWGGVAIGKKGGSGIDAKAVDVRNFYSEQEICAVSFKGRQQSYNAHCCYRSPSRNKQVFFWTTICNAIRLCGDLNFHVLKSICTKCKLQ